jgi:hypothetical protein
MIFRSDPRAHRALAVCERLMLDIFLFLGDDAVSDEDLFKFVALDGFYFSQMRGDGIQRIAMLVDDVFRFFMGIIR